MIEVRRNNIPDENILSHLSEKDLHSKQVGSGFFRRLSFRKGKPTLNHIQTSGDKHTSDVSNESISNNVKSPNAIVNSITPPPTLWDSSCRPRPVNDPPGLRRNPIRRSASMHNKSAPSTGMARKREEYWLKQLNVPCGDTIATGSLEELRKADHNASYLAPPPLGQTNSDLGSSPRSQTSSIPIERRQTSPATIRQTSPNSVSIVDVQHRPLFARERPSSFHDNRRHSSCMDILNTPKRRSFYAGSGRISSVNDEFATIAESDTATVESQKTDNVVLHQSKSNSSCSSSSSLASHNCTYTPVMSGDNPEATAFKPLRFGDRSMYDGQIDPATKIFHGCGVIITSNQYYFGEWSRGSPCGLGVYVNVAEKYKYEGNFSMGFAEGFGRFVFMGSEPQYQYGLFEAGCLIESDPSCILKYRCAAADAADGARELMGSLLYGVSIECQNHVVALAKTTNQWKIETLRHRKPIPLLHIPFDSEGIAAVNIAYNTA
ncbi:hypothetical protein SARC_10391 [Sphaeroforma arctica JP610]|uniref:Uncharacterized protein n=1 Tax=Sphaeroforma arctica JP610 TaxID=667725 RepID=A0A0L0FK42_9EUKA|nr:hypothetical protein SARC_10391 [Sphaeroforma arctica JP610]KNC77139.1 hypothetical protein SARC_10391 [Sphaeroforma arctica JP610]|eukprot:XP_014151041.1 hypothetical protein SARC_10391 [Sphaeroforma arctica JP610]